jgi:hypothetical protein
MLDVQAEQVLQLQAGDHRGDTRREAGRHGVRDELDEAPEAREPHDNQQDAGEQAGGEQARQPVSLDDRRQDDDERRRRPGHLELGAARERGDDAADDRRVQPVLRRDAGRDGERHRKRQGDDADHDSRERVGAERAPAVAGGERAAERDRDRQRRPRWSDARSLDQPLPPPPPHHDRSSGCVIRRTADPS